jgi:hypothetical protein
MRVLRGVLAAALLGVSAGVLLPHPAPAQAAPDNVALALSPTHGPANSVVTAQYQLRGVPCKKARVTFSWDGADIGRTQLRDNCEITVRFRPPFVARESGAHQVGAVDTVTRAGTAATFTIDAPAGTQQNQVPTHEPTTAAPTGAAATATTDPATAPSASAPVDLSPPPSAAVDAASATNPATPWTAGALIVGGVLVLGGVGILGVVLARMRRGT